jgi:hypothetical protein
VSIEQVHSIKTAIAEGQAAERKARPKKPSSFAGSSTTSIAKSRPSPTRLKRFAASAIGLSFGLQG